MMRSFLFLLIIFCLFNHLNAISDIDNKSHHNKHRYDINIDHETCTTAGQLRGYVKTPEMSLDNYNARFSPKMYSSWNLNWGPAGCSRSNQMTITPDTSAGESKADIFGLAALGPIGLFAGLGIWLSGFNMQSGGTLVKGEIQLIRVYGDKLCAYASGKDSEKVDGGEWQRLTNECQANPNGQTMLNEAWHDQKIYVPCKDSKPDCKLMRAFCGYVKSAGLDFHLLKCLQLPFLPSAGKMYNYIVSEERPRLIYLNDNNNDFFNIKVIVAIGSTLNRCAGDSYVEKGTYCVDPNGKQYTGYRTGENYDEKEVLIPFILDNDGQIEDYNASILLNGKNYDIKFHFEGNNLCAQYKKSGSYVNLNCLHHPFLEKPQNIRISAVGSGANARIKMTADFAEDLTKTAFSGNKIDIEIDAGSTQNLLSKINDRNSITKKKYNEFIIHDTVFSFFRAKLNGNDIEKRKKCLIQDALNGNITEKFIDINSSCDDGINVKNVRACDCGVSGVFLIGDPNCKTSCNETVAKQCPNDNRLEKDRAKDCNKSIIGYYDDDKGDHLCLSGWNDKTKQSVYNNKIIQKQLGFLEVENKGGNFVITDNTQGIIDVYNLNDQERKTMQFLGGDVFSIWRNGIGLKYYQWRERYYKRVADNQITYWMNKNTGYPEYISNSRQIQQFSPYKHGLCIVLDKKYRNKVINI